MGELATRRQNNKEQDLHVGPGVTAVQNFSSFQKNNHFCAQHQGQRAKTLREKIMNWHGINSFLHYHK